MDVPPVPAGKAAAARACAALVARLPAEVDPGVVRRPVTGDATRTAAWGDPPVLLRCGVPLPERLAEPVSLGTPEGQLVQWSVADIGDGYSYTTVDRTVPLEISVPGRYASPAEIVLPLLPAVVAALPAAPPPVQ